MPSSSPDTVALTWGKRTLTWDYLDAYIHSTARRLKEFGIKKGVRVLVEAVRSHETVIVFLSLWHAGAILCPVDPQLPAAALGMIISSSERPNIFIGPRKIPGLRCFTFNDTICVEPVEHFFSGVGKDPANTADEYKAIILVPDPNGTLLPVTHVFTKAPRWQGIEPPQKQDTLLPLHQPAGIAIIFNALCDRSEMIL